MQYAANLTSRRSLLVPVVSLAIGAAGAVGIYAVLDETDVTVEPTRVVVQQSPTPTAHDEAATAAAIGQPVQPVSSGKDESATAAAIAPPAQPVSPGKDESATAAAIAGPAERGYTSIGKDESATAAAVGHQGISALTGPRLRTP